MYTPHQFIELEKRSHSERFIIWLVQPILQCHLSGQNCAIQTRFGYGSTCQKETPRETKARQYFEKLFLSSERTCECPNEGNFTLQFVCNRSLSDTWVPSNAHSAGRRYRAKLVQCGIASEALPLAIAANRNIKPIRDRDVPATTTTMIFQKGSASIKTPLDDRSAEMVFQFFCVPLCRSGI